MALAFDVNAILAIVVAAVVNIVIGGIWYSRPVFGRRWMAAVGISEEQARKGAARAFAGATVGALIASTVLAIFLDFANATTVLSCATAGFLVWLGFLATTGGRRARCSRGGRAPSTRSRWGTTSSFSSPWARFSHTCSGRPSGNHT